jgi:hypothetical protein
MWMTQWSATLFVILNGVKDLALARPHPGIGDRTRAPWRRDDKGRPTRSLRLTSQPLGQGRNWQT